MNWNELTLAKENISDQIGLEQPMALHTFEVFIGAGRGSTKNWSTRGTIPVYIQYSIEQLLLLSDKQLRQLYNQRV